MYHNRSFRRSLAALHMPQRYALSGLPKIDQQVTGRAGQIDRAGSSEQVNFVKHSDYQWRCTDILTRLKFKAPF